jgi:hypothetical protein
LLSTVLLVISLSGPSALENAPPPDLRPPLNH